MKIQLLKHCMGMSTVWVRALYGYKYCMGQHCMGTSTAWVQALFSIITNLENGRNVIHSL